MKVTVKDIIEYLQKMNPDAEVWLDHDGWHLYNAVATDVQDLIDKRGIFQEWNGVVIIQN